MGENTGLALYHTMMTFDVHEKKQTFVGNKHFLVFPRCFLLYEKQILCVDSYLICHLQMLSFWTRLIFCRLVKNKLL